jgi:hypothetical protein
MISKYIKPEMTELKSKTNLLGEVGAQLAIPALRRLN